MSDENDVAPSESEIKRQAAEAMIARLSMGSTAPLPDYTPIRDLLISLLSLRGDAEPPLIPEQRIREKAILDRFASLESELTTARSTISEQSAEIERVKNVAKNRAEEVSRLRSELQQAQAALTKARLAVTDASVWCQPKGGFIQLGRARWEKIVAALPATPEPATQEGK